MKDRRRSARRGIAPEISEETKGPFLRCKRCCRIFGKEALKNFCPQCGIRTEIGCWPSGVGQRLFDAVEEFFGRDDKELTVILVCDLLELLLEMFFRNLFAKQRRPLSWIGLTLRRNKSLDLRLRYLFKETLRLSFPSAIRDTPFEGFDRRWVRVRSTRSQLLQTSAAPYDEEIAREAHNLAHDALSLFAWLNNRYCV